MRILIVGLGKFGRNLFADLVKKDHKVLGVDISQNKIDVLGTLGDNLFCVDVTEKEQLVRLKPETIDHVFVCILENERANILGSLLFKDMGIEKVTTLSISEIQRSALESIGIQIIDLYKEASMVISAKL